MRTTFLARARVVVLTSVCALLCVLPAQAQSPDRAVVLENAPIMLMPDASRTPLRVAATGTILVALDEEGTWLRVQFQGPQFGLRTGYIESRFVRIDRARLRPLDLSVPRPDPAPADVAPSISPAAAPAAAIQNPIARPLVDAPSPRAQMRQGFWFSGGLGVGSLGCDSCGGRATGLSGGLSLGGTLGDRWLLGFGTTGWARSVGNATLSVGTADARVRFYPVVASGFHINGGLGVGSISVGPFSEIGAGALFGLGWDIRVSRNVSLTPYYNGFAMRSGLSNANVAQLGLGVTVH